MKTDYDKQAIDFLEKTKTKFSTRFLGHYKYFPDDKEARDVYEVTFARDGRPPFISTFGQSIKESSSAARKGKAPTAYDVIACLTKFDPETFKDFCDSFGYDEDSRKAEGIYFAVQKEWDGVRKTFGDVLEELSEIN